MQAPHNTQDPTIQAGVFSETSNDLRAAFRVATHTLRLWEKAGKLPPAIKVGRRKLWPQGTIERLMAAARQEGGAA